MSMAIGNSQSYMQHKSPDVEIRCCSTIYAVSKLALLGIVSTIVIFSLLIAVIVLATRNSNSSSDSSHQKSSCTTADCLLSVGRLIDGINKKADPCEDFYEYACGKRISRQFENPSFIEESDFLYLTLLTEQRIKNILDGNVSTMEKDRPEMTKAKDAYEACLNADIKEGIQFVKDSSIPKNMPILVGQNWEDIYLPDFYENILDEFGSLGGIFFSIDVINDFQKDSTKNIVMISQPNKMLIEKILQLLTETKFKELVQILRDNESAIDPDLIQKDIREMQRLLNFTIKNYVKLPEDFSLTNESRISIKDFMNETSEALWLIFLNKVFKNIKTFKPEDEIMVYGLDYFKALGNNSDFTPRDHVNLEYMAVLSLFDFIKEDLTTNSEAVNFQFNRLSLKSIRKQSNEISSSERWQRCLTLMKNWFSFAISRKYGDHYLNVKQLRTELKEISENIVQAFRKRLHTLDWLTKTTKEKAELKLDHMKRNYVYPEWMDDDNKIENYYKNLIINKKTHNQNIVAATNMTIQKLLSQMSDNPDELNQVQTNKFYFEANAFYLSLDNSMNILEGILHMPLYGKKLQVMNYGSIGTIIGHEIIHGYDTQGSKFDDKGTLVEWMTKEEREIFQEKAKCFRKQYSEYKMTDKDIPGIKHPLQIDGNMTVAENIADHGGFQLSYLAYKDWVTMHSPENLLDALDEFTVDQIFFLSFAQTWCEKYWTKFVTVESIKSDDHSPAKFRVIGTLSNTKEFADAFNCHKVGTMNRGDERCTIW